MIQIHRNAPLSRFPVLLAVAMAAAAAMPSLAPADIWQDVDEALLAAKPGLRLVLPAHYRTMRLNEAELRAVLARAPMEYTAAAARNDVVLALPTPDGGLSRFRIEESPIMEAPLAARHPEIRTYRGKGIDDPTATTRFGWTSAGFHAIVLSGVTGTVYIDPYGRGDLEHVLVYAKLDNRRKTPAPFECQVLGRDGVGIEQGALPPPPDVVENHRGGALRTYRLAQAADFEYTSYHSDPLPAQPSKTLALNRGIIPTINRVDGIYERELSIHLTLVADEDSIIFDTPADPYTDQSGSAMLAQNQTTCDARIGSANYDIGHVFSTGGGGVAFLGVVCDLAGPGNHKAGGVTGSPEPISDSFDVDYVAHEMGHQFGANHSFNGNAGSCGGGNRHAATAYEVGSGSTIMAYAGICAPQDLQPHSDDNFHVISLQEIINYTDAGEANDCADKTRVPNHSPDVDAGPNYTIPARTPFTLTAVGSDEDGDAVTYNWEEFDRGPANAGTSDNGSSPIFRPFPSAVSPSRTFPRMSNVLSNTSTYGEVLPTTNRTMTFRCTIRDNFPGAGGVHWDATQVTVSNAAGPFVVSQPNGGETWNALRPHTVTWNVAGTSSAPVNTATVDILVSTDGGASFATLVTAAPNDGEETVTAPVANTSQARVLVRGGGNIFFDVSNADFTIAGKPFAIADTAATTTDTPVAIDVLANDSDPNGDPLAITVVSSPTTAGGTAAVQDNGTPGDPTDDTILYTPPAGFQGTDGFTYTNSDGALTDQASVTVTVSSQVAVAGPAGFKGLALRIRPNPVLDATQLDFQIDRDADVEMGVFSVAGRRVATIASGRRPAGLQSVRWDGRAPDGSRVPAGVYLARLVVGGRSLTRRMVIMR